MKKAMLKVLYYVWTGDGYRRYNNVMSEAEYLTLCMDEYVIVKRKKVVR